MTFRNFARLTQPWHTSMRNGRIVPGGARCARPTLPFYGSIFLPATHFNKPRVAARRTSLGWFGPLIQ